MIIAKKIWNWLWNDGAGAFIQFLLMILVGGTLLFLVSKFGNVEKNPFHKTLYEVGKILLTTVSVQPLFRLTIWRRAADSFLNKLQVKEAVSRSGLVDFCMFSKVQWDKLFTEATNISAIAISARFFTESSNYGLVKAFLSKPESSLTIVLLNPESDKAAALDAQFGETKGKRKDKTGEVVEELKNLAGEPSVKGKISIKFTDILPRYTCYVFDEMYIFSTYRMKPGRAPHGVPTFFFERGEFITEYVREDIDYIINIESKCHWENQPKGSKANAS